MTLWVRVALVLFCVGCVSAEPWSWSRSHGRREHRHRSRASSHRGRTRSHRPSVPETVHDAREDSAAQMEIQRLWNQWKNGTQSDQPQPKLSLLSLKQQLATRAGVNRLRKQGPDRAFDDFEFMNDAGLGPGNEDPRNEVVGLMIEIKENHSCGEPARQLVRVSDVYPSTSAIYIPHSVLLRRCSGQIGFCVFEFHTCVAVANVTIKIPVMVNHVVGGGGSRIKHLDFVEDTECSCMPKTETPSECPYNLPNNDASDVVGPRKGNKHSGRSSRQKEKRPAQQTCRCTSEFASRTMPDGSCKCDCFDSNRKCKRQRRGMTHLSEPDNRCIVRGNCEPPDCKYDKYEETRGRCPRMKGEWRRQGYIV